MARLFLVLTFACLLAVSAKEAKAKAAAGGKPKSEAAPADCKAQSAEAEKLTKEKSTLTKELAAAEEQLKKAKAEAAKPCDAAQFSVTAIFARSAGLVVSVSEHLLKHTTVDEQILAAASSVKVHAETVKSRISTVDYQGFVNGLRTHPVYLQHVAPHLSTASDALAPHLAKLDPVYKQAQEQYAAAYASGAAAMEKTVMPKVRQLSFNREVFSGAFSQANAKLGSLLDPVFKVIADSAPEHSSFLPTQPVDRFLLLLIVIVCVYIFTKIAVRLSLFGVKFSFKLLSVPLKLLRFTLRIFFCFATGCYCCGLCRSKKAPKADGKKKADGKATEAKSAPKATLAEVVQLLESSKKEGKLLDGAKKLAALAKSGKPFNKPKNVEGKELTKDILKQAISKFKEVNLKDLSL